LQIKKKKKKLDPVGQKSYPKTAKKLQSGGGSMGDGKTQTKRESSQNDGRKNF